MLTIQELEKQLKDEIYRRAKMYATLKDNIPLQGAIMDECRGNIMKFVENFIWLDKNDTLITDPEFAEVDVIPMIPFEYQREFIEDMWDCIQMGIAPIAQRTLPTKMFMEKSRQMGATWMVAIVFCYGFLFHNHRYLCLSQKEADVDSDDLRSIFKKVRIILEKLPQWMLPEDFDKSKGTPYNKHLLITKKSSTASISGDSTRSVRGGNYHAVFLDEMAYMENAREVDIAISASTPCVIYNSTPNGEFNEYYNKRKMAIEGKIRYHRMHWKENPLYTEEWYRWKTQGESPEYIAREYEIQYVTSLEGRVYPEFKRVEEDVDFDQTKPTFISIDNSHGGKDPHAVIVAQLDGLLVRVIDCVQVNANIDDMAELMAGNLKMELNAGQMEFFERCRKNYVGAVYIADPYDTNATQNDATIAQKYQKRGIHLNIFDPKKYSKESQIQIARGNMVRLRVHPRCTDFCAAIANARYPKRNDTSQATTAQTLPIHDQTSHYRSAFEYLMTYLEDRKPGRAQEKSRFQVPAQPQYRKNFVTGEIELI